MDKKKVFAFGIIVLLLGFILGAESRAFTLLDGMVEVKGYLRNQQVFRSPDLKEDYEHIQNRTTLRLELLAPATVHWSADAWQTVIDTQARATGLDVYIIDLPVEQLPANTSLVFTFHWSDSDTWEGTDFSVGIV